jgi:hypothetical protein
VKGKKNEPAKVANPVTANKALPADSVKAKEFLAGFLTEQQILIAAKICWI